MDPLIKSQLLYQLSYAPAAGGALYNKRGAGLSIGAPTGAGNQCVSKASANAGSATAWAAGTGRRGDQVKIEDMA